jgi:hypothetical protein
MRRPRTGIAAVSPVMLRVDEDSKQAVSPMAVEPSTSSTMYFNTASSKSLIPVRQCQYPMR